MKIYADTSALMAWFNPADEFAPAVTSWCRERGPEFFGTLFCGRNYGTIFVALPANMQRRHGMLIVPLKRRNG